jgi:RNA recognition motif. (a.k.a. RRM, RBD, or RNP domain)
MFLPKVEIQRTGTSQGVPISRHSQKGNAPGPSPTDPVSANGHTATSKNAGHNSAFQPYTPVITSNKRKREPQSKLPQESSDASLAVSITNTTPGQKIDVGKSAPEAEDQDVKKARRKEKKERKEHKSQVDQSHRDEDGQAGSDAADPETKSKKKKRNQGALDSGGADFAPHMAEDPANGVEVLQSAEKKKKREKKDGALAVEIAGDNDQRGNRSVSEPETLKKGQSHRSQVDDDIKGGVDSLDHGVSGLTGQSADQREQQRQNPDVTSDNEWLRAKTSRVLDLVDSDLEDDTPVPTKFEERSNEPAADREDEKTEELSASSARQVTSNENDLSFTGRLFVRNLPYTANELEIEKLFSKYGNLKEVRFAHNSLCLIFMMNT